MCCLLLFANVQTAGQSLYDKCLCKAHATSVTAQLHPGHAVPRFFESLTRQAGCKRGEQGSGAVHFKGCTS